MACWVQENQMNILPNFEPQYDRNKEKNGSIFLSDNIFWTLSTASPIFCSNKEGQNIFLSKGVQRGQKWHFWTKQHLFNKKITEWMRGVLKINKIAAVSPKIIIGNVSLVIVWRGEIL